jgi:hypothetical protein
MAADLAVRPHYTIIPTAETWLGSFDAGLFLALKTAQRVGR